MAIIDTYGSEVKVRGMMSIIMRICFEGDDIRMRKIRFCASRETRVERAYFGESFRPHKLLQIKKEVDQNSIGAPPVFHIS